MNQTTTSIEGTKQPGVTIVNLPFEAKSGPEPAPPQSQFTGPALPPQPLFSFDCKTLDLLDRQGNRRALRHKAKQALLILARQPGQVVRKQDLFQAIWPNTCVTEDSLVQIVGDIRQALRDNRRELLITRYRVGYQLQHGVICLTNHEPDN